MLRRYPRPVIADRAATYQRVSADLAALDDTEFAAIFQQGSSRSDWAPSYPVRRDGQQVFVKRVPLTDVERTNPGSTRNHHGVPICYQYGVGSFGTNSFRELAAHLATTQWVLDGAARGFPLLYHHRIMPRTGKPAWPEHERQRHFHHWADSVAIATRSDEQAAADFELCLVLEHVPHPIHQWLPEHPHRTSEVISQLFDCADLLRAHGFLHCDAHFGNVLTDGQQAYLTDFGLVLSSDFELTADEREFLARHEHYDHAEVIQSLDWIRAEMPDLQPEYERYDEVIRYMTGFFDDLRANPKKDTWYDDRTVRDLLRPGSDTTRPRSL